MPITDSNKTYPVRIALLLIPAVFFGCLFLFQPAEKPESEIISDNECKVDLVEQEKTAGPDSQTITGTIPKKGTLYSSLHGAGAPQGLIVRIIRALEPAYDMRYFSPGDSYFLEYLPPDTLVSFEYRASGPEKYLVLPNGDSFVASKAQKDLDRFLRCVRGKVAGSLWRSMVEMGEDPTLILKLADIFAWDIDFLTEVREGDEFELIVEYFEENDNSAFYGNILAARCSFQGSDHFGILYEDPEGNCDYYDLEGRSLRKTLLKSPLNYQRISSGYSMSRLHPILKIRRPHYGVDYVAKTGTPVVAAGDGLVTYKGWKGQYGNTVIIRHSQGFQTYYGHLSRFPKDLCKGKKVKQGQVIGYVGSTGLSTGPHLDYRIKKGGKYIDPLKLVPPSVKPVQKKFIQDFFHNRDKILATMQSIKDDSKIYVAPNKKEIDADLPS